MTSIISILTVLLRGYVVACITSGTHHRFTVCRWGDTGEICQINATCRIVWYSNIWQYCKHLRQAESAGVRYDAAIVTDVKQEQEFLAGNEAAAVLI